MWSRLRILARASHVVGEPVLDTVFVVRNRRGHRLIAVTGLVLGVLLGTVPFGGWSPMLAIGIVAGGGLGLNLGTDFRFLARTAGRLVVLESSRAAAWPVATAGDVDPEALRTERRGVWLTMQIGGEPHWTARSHHARVERMAAAVVARPAEGQPTSSHHAE